MLTFGLSVAAADEPEAVGGALGEALLTSAGRKSIFGSASWFSAGLEVDEPDPSSAASRGAGGGKGGLTISVAALFAGAMRPAETDFALGFVPAVVSPPP